MEKIHTEYTAERIAKSLEKCWLEKDVWGNWRMGMGARGGGGGWRVPNKHAQAAIKRPDVARYDTGLGVIYIASSRLPDFEGTPSPPK